MYLETVNTFAKIAEKKKSCLQKSPMAFFLSAVMAGVYVGFGIILILNAAGQLEHPYQKLIMGLTFGIALTLIVFAGAELFTGHVMYMVFGCLQQTTNITDLAKMWLIVWVGNFLGSILLAIIFVIAGGSDLFANNLSLLQKVISFKVDASITELLARGILCNWLVCLSLWMCARTQSDSTKCIVIFWCLFAFIASSYEHSVANMTIFSLGFLLMQDHTLLVNGIFYNLLWVTLGNIIGGGFFIAYGYWFISKDKTEKIIKTSDLPLTQTNK